jgi:hypothetical protein
MGGHTQIPLAPADGGHNFFCTVAAIYPLINYVAQTLVAIWAAASLLTHFERRLRQNPEMPKLP